MYTFDQLSDADFEDLASDLMAAELGVSLRRVARSHDLGIDAFRGEHLTGGLVVQAKHYVRSGFTKLRRTMVKSELPKIEALNPERYILVTSISLSAQQKCKLFQELTPHVRGIDDIIGAEDLNGMLRNRPDIERRHHKLWLTSTAVLESILNRGMEVWGQLQREEVERALSVYVQTDAYQEAIDRLETYNYCVISGIPGVGKTTLARILVTRLMDAGFEVVHAQDDITPVFEVLDQNRRQVVFYDDFLGRSSIAERLRKNEDQTILTLLRSARKSPRLKVIFTTREYLLKDAYQVYESFAGTEIDLGKCIVDIQSYTRDKRARMLYNHLFFSAVPRPYIASLVQAKGYRKIIDHPNFSPRLIEWMTLTEERVGGLPSNPTAYAEVFMGALDKPDRIWIHAFEHQILIPDRSLLYALATFGDPVEKEALRYAWREVWRLLDPDSAGKESYRTFARSLKTLDGTFLKHETDLKLTTVSFANPSIQDFLQQRIAEDFEFRLALLSTVKYFEQAETLSRLDADGQIGTRVYEPLSGTEGLERAFRETLSQPPATVEVVRVASGQHRIRNETPNYGDRLAWVCASLDSSNSNEQDGIPGPLLELTRIAIAANEQEPGYCFGAIVLLDVVLRVPRAKRSEWVDTIDTLLDHIQEELHADDDREAWLRWGEFLAEHHTAPELFRFKIHRDKVTEMCAWEADAMYCPETAENVRDRLEWMERAEEVWQIDASEWKEQLQSRLEELEQAEEEKYDAWRDDHHAEREQRRESDAEIDALFESLVRD